MSYDKRSGYKTLLYVDPAGGTTWEQIEGILEGISGPSAMRDEADTTALDDNYETNLPGVIRTGELTFDHIYDPASATSQTLTDLFTQTSPIPSWKISYQILDGTSGSGEPLEETFSGWVKGLSREVNMGQALKRTVTIRVSGDPGFTGS